VLHSREPPGAAPHAVVVWGLRVKHHRLRDHASLRICQNGHILCYVNKKDKPLAWLYGQVKSPPLSGEARIETGFLLRRLQRGERLRMPQSRSMPSVGVRCHELRINDADTTWRLIYRIDTDAIVIVEVFAKKTPKTPKDVIQACRKRLKEYDDA